MTCLKQRNGCRRRCGRSLRDSRRRVAAKAARASSRWKASNTGGAASMGMGPCAAGYSPCRGLDDEVTPVSSSVVTCSTPTTRLITRLVRAYCFRAATPSSGSWTWASSSTPCAQRSTRPRAHPRLRRRRVHLARCPARGWLEPGPRAAATMTKRMTERAQALGRRGPCSGHTARAPSPTMRRCHGREPPSTRTAGDRHHRAKAVIVYRRRCQRQDDPDYIGLGRGRTSTPSPCPAWTATATYATKVGAGHTP